MAIDPKNDTGAYSPTKAPEIREHAEEKTTQPDVRLHPGGAHGTPMPTGMEALDRENVPSQAARSEPLRTGDRLKP